MGLWTPSKGMVIHYDESLLEYVTHRRVTKNHYRYKIERLHIVEDKLADEIKKVITEESAKIRTTSMTEAKLKAEHFHTEHTMTWMPPEELENEVISTLIKAFRYDAIAKGTEGMTSWDTEK